MPSLLSSSHERAGSREDPLGLLGRGARLARVVTAASMTLIASMAGAAGCSGLRALPSDPATPEDRLVRKATKGDPAQREVARRHLERHRFREAARLSTVFGWRRFLRLHPRGLFSEQARNRLVQLAFEEAIEADRTTALRRFLRLHSEHSLAPRVWRLINQRRAEALASRGSRSELVAFLERYPSHQLAAKLRGRMEELDFAELGPKATLTRLEAFVSRYPRSRHRPTVRGWIESRLAERVLHFGGADALRAFEQRFPGSRHLAGLRSALRQRRAVDSLRTMDIRQIRSLARESEGELEQGLRALEAWVRGLGPRRARVGSLLRAALPFRPRARLPTLLAAARMGQPQVVAQSLRSLVYFPTLAAVRALVRATASPEGVLGLEAADALARWTRRHHGEPARRLLLDLHDRERARPGPVAPVIQAALLRTLGDWKGLRGLLAGRTWHRPWELLPLFFYQEALPGEASEPIHSQGKRLLSACREETRKLGQMWPGKLQAANRARAEAAAFEMYGLARLVRRVLARRGELTADWVRGLGELHGRLRERHREMERGLSARFPGYRPASEDDLLQRADRHRRSRARAARKLAALLPRKAPPSLVGLLCRAEVSLPRGCGGAK